MSGLPFYIVDVFAQARYQGNQLAVFVGGDDLTTDQMQAIAREMHYSETSFVLLGSGPHDDMAGGVGEGPRRGATTGNVNTTSTYRVRIFTPEHEVPFAGHPTLGTAHIIRTVLSSSRPDVLNLALEVGTIPVAYEDAGDSLPVYWMEQVEPQFGCEIDRAALADVIGLGLRDFDDRFPVEEVSTGLPHIIVPLRSLDALKRTTVSRDKYFDLIERTWAKNVFIFSPEPHLPGNHLSARMFADYLGIPEDPATGSGNGCLAGYLVKHRYFGGASIDIRVEQGFEVKRPSLLFLRASEQGGHMDVRVGGSAITVAKGELL